jgi:diguanylate cyclase (GGDEF)-like protein
MKVFRATPMRRSIPVASVPAALSRILPIPILSMLVLLAVLACVDCARAATAPLTSLRAVKTLSDSEASRNPPVAFEATVTYYVASFGTLFLQDGDDGIYANCTKPYAISIGDRVLVRGVAIRSFRPFVSPDDITVIRHGRLPTPLPSTFDGLIGAQRDSRLVTLRATVRAADPWSPNAATLQLVTDGGHFQALLAFNDQAAVNALLDADVEVTGVEGGEFDDKMELTGIILFVGSLDQIRVLKRSPTKPLALPVMPMNRIVSVYHARDLTPRVRVRGTITYFVPGSAAVIQSGTTSLWISTHTVVPIRIGDMVDVTGFAEQHEHHLVLADAEISDTYTSAPIRPFHGTWNDLNSWPTNSPTGHQNDLVSIDGVVVKAIRETTQDDYFIASSGHIFTSVLHLPAGPSPPPMREIAPGSTVRVTGICNVLDGSTALATQQAPFNILLRSYDDIAVLARPSPVNVRNLLILAGLLLLLLFAAGIRSWALERAVRRESTAAAYLEQRRARILEDINKSRPLGEILEDITEMVSFRLHGAACWCEIAGAAPLGKMPPVITSQRVIQREISGRADAPLGSIFAAIHHLTKPDTEEGVALSQGAGLATLAIETSRLYSDLVHRSEFDLLTDVPNRFSLEKQLAELIHQGNKATAAFGLIFIDFDGFKQVNDRFGHQVGDIYLQQAVLRMKHQLRPGDSLARLGGDEFAAVVPAVSNRTGVEEVAQRLERCFTDPFSIGGRLIQGKASVGVAFYPEDADSTDSLLSKADAAMYAIKQQRKTDGQKSAEGAHLAA